MANKLDLSIFNTGVKSLIVGYLTDEMIAFLKLNRKPCNILLWEDRLKYMEKHKKDVKSEEDYYKHIEQIPNILKNPQYLGLHPKDNSIQFIKRIDELMLVGVRIKTEGSLNIRSSYPITQKQLNTYIECNTAWEFKIVDNKE